MVNYSCSESRESILFSNSQLMQLNEELQRKNIILNTQLKEMETNQTEAFEARVAQMMSRVEEKLLKIIEDQGYEIAELKKNVAPLKAERDERLEAEHVVQEKYQRERKEAAFNIFRKTRFDLDSTKQIDIIQSMSPEEIEYVLQQDTRHFGLARQRLIGRILLEEWTKERILQSWY